MGFKGESTQTSATSVDGGEAKINLKIRCANANKFSVRSTLRSTVGAFKDLLAQNCDVPANQQRLIYKGRILQDDQTLDSYGLQADHTVHMVRGSAPGAPPSPGFGSGLSELEQMQQQLPQSPNMWRDMMEMAEIEYILNNPEAMREVIMRTPQLRVIVDRNPELFDILNNPSILRERINNLSSQYNELTTSQQDLAKAFKDLLKAYKDLSDQVNGLTTRVTTLEHDLAFSRTRIKELEARLKAATAGKRKVQK